MNEVINYLNKNFKIVIGSNRDTAPLEQDLKRSDVHFDHFFSSESLMVYKPSKGFYDKIKKLLNENDFSRFIFIGDSPKEDVIMPKSLGMKTIWINRKNRLWDYNDVVPDLEIKELKDLKNYF